MPAWEAYKHQAQSRGAMAFELFAVLSTPTGTPEALQAVLPDHLAYQAQLERDGALVFAGPMSDETGEQMQGMGLIVYRAASFAEARAIAENDPMHKAGARSFTLRRWMINEGRLTVTVGLSGRTVALS